MLAQIPTISAVRLAALLLRQGSLAFVDTSTTCKTPMSDFGPPWVFDFPGAYHIWWVFPYPTLGWRPMEDRQLHIVELVSISSTKSLLTLVVDTSSPSRSKDLSWLVVSPFLIEHSNFPFFYRTVILIF